MYLQRRLFAQISNWLFMCVKVCICDSVSLLQCTDNSKLSSVFHNGQLRKVFSH